MVSKAHLLSTCSQPARYPLVGVGLSLPFRLLGKEVPTGRRQHPLLSPEQRVACLSGSPWGHAAGAGGDWGLGWGVRMVGNLGQAQPGLLPVSQPRRGLLQTKGQENTALLCWAQRSQPKTRRLQGQRGCY